MLRRNAFGVPLQAGVDVHFRTVAKRAGVSVDRGHVSRVTVYRPRTMGSRRPVVLVVSLVVGIAIAILGAWAIGAGPFA